MPLALANDRKLNNFTIIIPAGHSLDSLPLVVFIRDFRRPGVFWKNQEQTAQNFN
jgi:hypothetical protein